MARFVCGKCGRTSDLSTASATCECGGLWDLDFEPPAYDPALIDESTWGMFRYRAFMPLIGDAWRDVTLGEGMTPLVRLEDGPLLKMDYCMPTLSFKDRGAAVLVSHAKDIGVASVVQDSSGNAGNSVAAYCARAHIGCEIFVPEGTSPKKIDMIRAHGATCTIVPGSRDHCADVCREKVRSTGAYYASHVFNPMFYEGTKTYVYEIYEQLGRIPDYVFVPLGNGTLFLGITRGLEHLLASGGIDHMPHVVAIQSERCDPLAAALGSGSGEPERVEVAPTLAEGIAIGEPMRGEEILRAVRKHGFEIITAPEDAILRSREALARQGIYCEHTTAANYAAYLDYCSKNGKIDDAVIPMCGAGLKSDH